MSGNLIPLTLEGSCHLIAYRWVNTMRALILTTVLWRREINMKRVAKSLSVLFLLLAFAGCTVGAAGPTGAGAAGASAQGMPWKDKP
jgi:hypothetical protein